MSERLDRHQIEILRSLMKRGGATRAISLDCKREPIVPLWRRGIVEIWYRQAPDSRPSLQGPYYGLTISGAQLASSFFAEPAPRGFSGAEQQP